jgi:DNA polymerase I-like protein with 3'-5' exonuclease and polymerase domains/uracil-DNA glycosylase
MPGVPGEVQGACMIHPIERANAKILIVGEWPHEQDLLNSTPFIGGAGFELKKMCKEAGFFFEDCSATMVMRGRVQQGKIESLFALKKKEVIFGHHQLVDGKWATPEVLAARQVLKAEIERLKPNVVLTFGNLGLWALTGEWGAKDWRSSVMESTLCPGVKVIPTINPNQVMAQWKLRPLIVHDLRRALRESKTPVINRPKYDFLIRPTFEQAKAELLSYIALAKAHTAVTGERRKIGGDIETRAGHISCIAFAKSKTEAFCIPFMQSGKAEGYWSEAEEAELVFLIYQLCLLVTIVGQNWNYDAQYFYRWWHFICPSVKDTMIQQHSCFSNMEKNLAFLSSMYLDDHLYWKDDRTNWTEGPKGEGEDKYWIYNCTDAVRTLAIEEVLSKVVSAMGLQAVDDFQQRLAPRVLKTMNRGLRVDMQRRAQFAMELMAEVASREAWLADVTGSSLNIKSPKQMADFFYRQMGMRPIINRKTKGVTTDDEALHRIASREPILAPVTRKIAELRSLGVFHSTFVSAPLDTDGRMRTSFNVCGTDTYRFASAKNAFGTGANLQNIPKGGETEDEGLELPNIRTLYIPDPGHTFFDIDLDSADLRVVTGESGCKWMLEQFTAGRKPYVEVMKEYYRNPSMTKNSHPREYAMFKALCHGTNYLGTPEGISPRIGLIVKEVERIQKWYFGLCPEIKAWQDEIKKQVSGRRWIQNVFGYRFHFFDRIEGNVFNQAVAWIPQSTVGCLINRAYENIDNNLPEVEVLLQVHDSLAGQFETHHGDWALRRIVEESQIVLPYATPMIVPVGVVSSTKSWGDCQ